MGVCLSKGGHPHHHHHHHPAHMFMTDDDGFCTPEGVSSQYESPNPSGRYSFAHLETPRVSADVGDFGVLGSLFYKRGNRSREGYINGGGLGLGMGTGVATNFISPLDMFLGGVSGRNRVHHVNQICTGDYSFASYLASPLLKGFDVHAMEAVAKSYAESAAKAAARDTFVFLEENDVSVTTFPCNGGGREIETDANAPKLPSTLLGTMPTTSEAGGGDEDEDHDDIDDDLAKSEESEEWQEPSKSEDWDETTVARTSDRHTIETGSGSGSISPSFRAENQRATSDRWDSVLNAVQARAKARRKQRKRSVPEAGGGIVKGQQRTESGKGRKKSVRFRLDEDGNDAETEGEMSMTDEDFRSGKESDFEQGVEDEEGREGSLTGPNDVRSLGGAELFRSSVPELDVRFAAAASPATVAETSRDNAWVDDGNGYCHPGGEEGKARVEEDRKVRVEEEIKDAEFGGFSTLEVLGGLTATASEVLDGLRVGVVEPTTSVVETGDSSGSALAAAPSSSFPRPRSEHHHLHVHQPSLESFSSAQSFLPDVSFGSSSHEQEEESGSGSGAQQLLLEDRAEQHEEDKNEATSNPNHHHDHPQREDPETGDAGENFSGHADRGESSCTDRQCISLPTNLTVFESCEAGAAPAAGFIPPSNPSPQREVPEQQQLESRISSSSGRDNSIANTLTPSVEAAGEPGAGSGDETETATGLGLGSEAGAGAGAGAGPAAVDAPPAIPVGCVVVETRLADGSRLNPQILDLKEVQLPERGEHTHGLFHPRILSTPAGEEDDDPSSNLDQEGGFSFPVLVVSTSLPSSVPSSRPERSLPTSFPSINSSSSTSTTTTTFTEREPPPPPPRESAWEDPPPLDLETPIKSRTIRLYTPPYAQPQPLAASPRHHVTAKRDVHHIFSHSISSLPHIVADGSHISSSESQHQHQQQQQHQHHPPPRSSFSFDVEPTINTDRTHEIVLPTMPSLSTTGRSKTSPVFNPSPKSSAPSLLPAIQVSSIPYQAKARRTFNKRLKFYSLERASYAASGAKRSKSPPHGGLCSMENRDAQGGTTSGETDGESESDLFEIETMSGTNAMGSSRTPPSTPTKGQSPPGPGSKVPSSASNAFDFERLTDSIARVSRSRSKRKGDSNSNSRVASKAVHADELQREGDGVGVVRGAPSSGATRTTIPKGGGGSSQSYLKGRALLKLGFLMRSNKQLGGHHGRYPRHRSRSDHSRDSDVCESGEETSVSEYLENKPPSPGATVPAAPSSRYHHPATHHFRGGQCCGIVEEERAPHSSHHSHHQHQGYSSYAFDWYCSSMPHKITPLLPQEKRQHQQQNPESFTSHSRSFSNEDRTFAVKN